MTECILKIHLDPRTDPIESVTWLSHSHFHTNFHGNGLWRDKRKHITMQCHSTFDSGTARFRQHEIFGRANSIERTLYIDILVQK